MKTTTCDEWQVTGGKKEHLAQASNACHVSRVTCHACRAGAERRRAFTLVEVLTVIAIIAVIAALILPVASAVKRRAFVQTAQSEMSQIETALESYHSAYGFYPPDNTNTVLNLKSALTNQLYYELSGTFITNGNFETLDSSAQIGPANMQSVFGVSGFMNCNKPGGDESASRAQDFLPDLKSGQIATIANNGVAISNLVTLVGGPDSGYWPCGQQDVNPWRYVYPGINNPGSYDLWVQLSMGSSFDPTTHRMLITNTYLICNWNNRVQNNQPLP